MHVWLQVMGIGNGSNMQTGQCYSVNLAEEACLHASLRVE